MSRVRAEAQRDHPRRFHAIVLVSVGLVAGLLGGMFAPPLAGGAVSSQRGNSPQVGSGGAALSLTWKNLTPTGFSASPCYTPGPHAAICNVTYWVSTDPNGTCNYNGTARYLTGVYVPVQTSFYFASGSPTIPSRITYCGGGSAALPFHFWFYVVPATGIVRATVTVKAG